ncbi:MAG TPA: prepilin-type N-terminal cleavage/methylation domain-containing protein [Anaerohalosphaeraceae bacterium]|nr:prepilin-type N-terminal cleavage/methylation domain-containing protein [Anaerohalosphaeraceae bacterium]HOL31213.1 prepilin-type N-terminal cleavage/methylation domain-containing protein [Anaerohalosphaeraceae bacterium]HOM75448.1 prepilin-type N-terminal cleavage/methylation domain-containing protein [Anaerohalosphaeraceae bacterium]HPC63824.1 prepilin-type N-terminal cleavage/methylation domain-containing protein [Anaerohalosphaeraceae bacterium]HPO69501.1 prepilin-type N-terminal cleavag
MMYGKTKGFTLLEATMAMVIVAIAAAGVLLPFAQAASVHAEAARQTMAANLASEMMEIIAASPYDTIMDYNGQIENPGQLKDSEGNYHTGSAYEGFGRSVLCQHVGSVNLAKVTVVVTYRNAPVTRITTLIGNHR